LHFSKQHILAYHFKQSLFDAGALRSHKSADRVTMVMDRQGANLTSWICTGRGKNVKRRVNLIDTHTALAAREAQ
jgi:hypothetical protein